MTTTTSANTTSANISPIELRRLIEHDPTTRILDVRTPAEFDGVHIPNSYNVPLDIVHTHAQELAESEHPLVLICRSGARATQARRTLANAGAKHLLLLDGGIEAWQADDGDVVRGQTETWALDRQVRLAAGSIALAGVLASVALPGAKWLAGGVAGGLVFSATTDTCAMGNLLARLPYNRSTNNDVLATIQALRTGGRTS